MKDKNCKAYVHSLFTENPSYSKWSQKSRCNETLHGRTNRYIEQDYGVKHRNKIFEACPFPEAFNEDTNNIII